MSPSNPLFAAIILAIAFGTAYLIRRKYAAAQTAGRFETIDGMRGFLAIGVFIHHCYIWYDYAKTGNWHEPDSSLYLHFGQTTVMLFFMITGFLFTGKLLHTTGDFNWKHFFVSRWFRLAPMYYVSLALLVFFVFDLSNWQLQADVFSVAKAIARWGLFAVFGSENINASNYTAIINAGVVWSLPYEWLFYFCLPLIGLVLLKKKPNVILILIGILMAVVFSFHKYINPYCFVAFAGGAFPAFLMRHDRIIRLAKSNLSALFLFAWPVLIVQFDTAYDVLAMSLIILLFTLIALGNSAFGLLQNRTLKLLGDIGYSTYLLHGILLFTTMHYMVGMESVRKFSATEYCVLQFLLTPFVVGISFLGYRYIEKPFMDYSQKLKQHSGLIKPAEKLQKNLKSVNNNPNL